MPYALNSIKFKKGQGGSGRIANGNDFISALLFFNDTRPTGFDDNIKDASNAFVGGVHQIFSPDEAKNLGIVPSHVDETKADGSVQITNVGADDDTIEIKVLEWTGGSGLGLVSLGKYKKVSADSTAILVATAVVAAINAGTNAHGYTADNTGGTTDTVDITSRAGTGLYLNSGTPITTDIVGTIAATITQFASGVASKLDVYYYHIQRYFAVKPDGSLYVGIFDIARGLDALEDMETYSLGTIVQLGLWDDQNVFDVATLTSIQTKLDDMETKYKFLSSVIYAADIIGLSGGITDLAGASYNLATQATANKVTAIIDGDGNGVGWDLFNASGMSITSLGAALGCLSEAAISEDFGNPIARFNPNDGVEFDKLIFADGTPYESVATSKLDSLNDNRYLFLSKIPYTPGSFYSDDHTSTAYTSDYAWIHDNRIIDRVIKNSFTALTPILKSRLKLTKDGTLTAQTIAYLVQLEGEVIKPLIASDDLAGDAENFNANDWVKIDPLQKPNQTGKLTIAVVLYENGIAHKIEVPIGFGS